MFWRKTAFLFPPQESKVFCTQCELIRILHIAAVNITLTWTVNFSTSVKLRVRCWQQAEDSTYKFMGVYKAGWAQHCRRGAMRTRHLSSCRQVDVCLFPLGLLFTCIWWLAHHLHHLHTHLVNIHHLLSVALWICYESCMNPTISFLLLFSLPRWFNMMSLNALGLSWLLSCVLGCSMVDLAT